MKVCPLCGLKFSEAEAQQSCKSCPLGKSCNLICCPNCGYQAPAEPRWLSRVRHRWRQRYKRAAVRAEALTLAGLEPGRVAEILGVRSQDDAILRRLTALGLLPGVKLQLVRTFPCYLLQLGHAQIALDKQLASEILVRTD